VLIGAVALVAAATVWLLRGGTAQARYLTAEADRGDVVDVVGATGTLQAVTTVQVGSQVSGTIQSLHADFNSVVKRGQVIARLDPSLLEARLGQTRASLVSARANAERARTTVEDTRQKYKRAQELATQNLLPETDLETAKANYDGATASLKAAEAAVTQAEANVNQGEVDLAHTVITAPIDGVVINRSVDVGQTVAASFQAPVLFVIANDLTRMQVNASIDEADIGRVRQGMEVSFRVDAYPEQPFTGRVEQVRLQPNTVQNVVTYNTIIAVDNADLRLMPGMTATVSVIIRRAQDAVRIPAAALRFRPEGFDFRRGAPGSPGLGASTAPSAGASAPAPSAASAPTTGATAADGPAADSLNGDRNRGRWRGEGGRSRGEGRSSGGGERPGWPRERRVPGSDGRAPMFRVVPGVAPTAGGSRGDGGAPRGTAPGAVAAGAPTTEQPRPGVVFVLDDKGVPQPVRIRTGIADGQFVEVVDGLEEGTKVVTGVEGEVRAATGRPGGAPTANPFAPAPRFQGRQR
jgi:HlyD family secretion protein